MTAAVAYPTEYALSGLAERLAEEYAELPLSVVFRVIAAARVGSESQLRPVRNMVADVEQHARRDLDRIVTTASA
jgi:hypothetical protein